MSSTRTKASSRNPSFLSDSKILILYGFAILRRAFPLRRKCLSIMYHDRHSKFMSKEQKLITCPYCQTIFQCDKNTSNNIAIRNHYNKSRSCKEKRKRPQDQSISNASKQQKYQNDIGKLEILRQQLSNVTQPSCQLFSAPRSAFLFLGLGLFFALSFLTGGYKFGDQNRFRYDGLLFRFLRKPGENVAKIPNKIILPRFNLRNPFLI